MTILKIKVQSNASKNEIAGKWLDMIKIKVTAAPENGKANKSCIELLSKELGVPKNKIKIIKGQTCREKVIEVK